MKNAAYMVVFAVALCWGCGSGEVRPAAEIGTSSPLADEARRRGIDKDPKVRRQIDRLLTRELLARVRKRAEDKVTEAEARKYHQEHLDRFTEPAHFELYYVGVRDAARATALEKSLAALADLKARASALRRAGRKYAADVTGRERGAYLGWLTSRRASALCGKPPSALGSVTASSVGAVVAVCLWGRRRAEGRRDFASARVKVLRLLRNRAGKAAVDELRNRLGE